MGQMSQAKRDGLRLALAGMLGAVAVLVASLALTAPAKAESRAHASIIGGSSTTSEEWPWAAFVLALDRHEEGFVCTGTVVAPTLILTAGHCIKDVLTGRSTPVHRYIVVTGSGDVRDRTIRQVSKVVRTAVYPGFDRFKLHGDAGLLVLATPTTAPAVALAGASDAGLLGPGLPTYIAGWGVSSGGAKPRQSPILRRARTYVQRLRYCRNHARVYYPFFNTTQLCTTTPPEFAGGGTCHGDSGGPALAFREDGTPVQIGITSLGPVDCDRSLPDVFTRVDRISGWIGEWIARSAAPVPVAEG
jgi:secreted trypsin-like serine protease